MDKMVKPYLSSDELLTQATCAIIIDGQIRGTAWLVDFEGHLLTAGHVLGTNTPCSQVKVQFQEDVTHDAFKIQWGYQQSMGEDFAVLRLSNIIKDRTPLPILLSRSVAGNFRVRGYGITLVSQSIGKGEFLGFFDPQGASGNRLFQLRSPELGEKGYSGAAVFSDTLQAVVAIQVEATKSTTGAGRDTLLAVPLYRIAQKWEPLQNLERKSITNDQQEMLSFVSEDRLRAIKDNIRNDLELLKEYEDSLRLEDDPQRRKRYEKQIAAIRKSLRDYEDEYARLTS